MIFYFSATGNCQYVASRVARVLKEQMVSIADCLDKKQFSFEEYENGYVGIIAPTYAWGIPSIVIDFLKQLKIKTSKNTYIYFIATYGTTPGNSGYFANKYLKSQTGLGINAYYSVKMPDTWTPIFNLSNKAKISLINDAAESQIDNIIEKIQRFASGNFMHNKMPCFTKIFYQPYYSHMNKTKNFIVEDNCIGCGLCERRCPVHAIEMQGKRPVWIKTKCTMCLGCLHRCPKFAIQYGKNTKKHGQYLNPHIYMEE